MFKIVFLVACLASTFDESTSSTNIECKYDVYTGNSVSGSVYRCIVNNNPKIITEESAEIIGINGTHESSKSNDDVAIFRAEYKTIHFFPKGMDKFFKNIKVIFIDTCQLKEIRQSDLKGFPNLVYFLLTFNDIEVIEEGLFDFNPNLESIRFHETKIIYIDPNVFDHLTKLSYIWFSSVPCLGQDIDQVQEAIKLVKSKCSCLEFLSLDNQINYLEIESKILSSEAFNSKLESFVKRFNNSKFSKFRPLNRKYQNLKSVISTNQNNQVHSFTLIKNLKNITDKFENLKTSQCELNQPIDEQIQANMTSSINNVISKVNEVTSTQNVLKGSFSQIEDKVNDLKSSQTNSINVLSSKISGLDNTQKDHGAMLSDIKSSLTNVTSKLDKLEKDMKSIKDDTKLSISDIVVTLSDHKRFQNDVKDSLIKIRTSQNEVKVALNNNFEDKLAGFEGKLGNVEGKLTGLSDKFEGLEGHFVDFKAELDKNEKELTNKLHKMSTNFDEKIKGIEKRLMKKFEEILVDKLEKNFN